MDSMNIFKFGRLWQRFTKDHPKFPNFISKLEQVGLQPGDIVALSVTKENGEIIKSNVRLTKNDIDSFNELKNINKK